MLLLGPSPNSPTDAVTLVTTYTRQQSALSLYTEHRAGRSDTSMAAMYQHSVRALSIVDFVDLM